MFQRKNRSRQRHQRVQQAHYRRRLRWSVVRAVARFHQLNPQWRDYFFELRFLLNRGLAIVEKHVAGDTTTTAIDLALAWSEEWPTMNASQRKACVQAATVMAAELLRLVVEAMARPHALHDATPENAASWRGVGVPVAYVQAQLHGRAAWVSAPTPLHP